MGTAILGGSFDPVHNGHVELAETVIEALGVDETVLVPARQNPLKRQSFATAEQRLEMCRLACTGHPRVVASDVETSRPGKSFTVDTLEEYRMAVPGDLWLVMGTDTLATLSQWKRPLRVVQIARLAVFERPGKPYESVAASLPEAVRDAVDLVKAPKSRASSSLVRDLIARGEPADMWLHPKVWEYILESGLYKS